MLSTPEAQSSGKIPIIFLRDVTFAELACLLDFIYSGSGQLPPELVASFSRLAHELGLKGFVRNPDSLKMPPATPQSPSRKGDGTMTVLRGGGALLEV